MRKELLLIGATGADWGAPAICLRLRPLGGAYRRLRSAAHGH